MKATDSMFGQSNVTAIADNTFNDIDMGIDMFYECSSLQSIGNNCFNSVTYGYEMFYYCDSLQTIGNNCFNSITNGYEMFYYCESLTSIPDGSFNSLQDGSYMFYDCYSLETIGNNCFNSLTYGYEMFYYCYQLKTIPLLDMPYLIDASEMFYGCYNVKSGQLDLYTKLWDQSVYGSYMFYDCGSYTETGMLELDEIASSWGGTFDYWELNCDATYSSDGEITVNVELPHKMKLSYEVTVYNDKTSKTFITNEADSITFEWDDLEHGDNNSFTILVNNEYQEYEVYAYTDSYCICEVEKISNTSTEITATATYDESNGEVSISISIDDYNFEETLDIYAYNITYGSDSDYTSDLDGIKFYYDDLAHGEINKFDISISCPNGYTLYANCECYVN